MELVATVSIDLKKQRFAGVRGHNNRVGNPSNENIKPELTQYNERVVVEDYDTIIEDYLGDYVKEVDKNRSNNPNAKNAKYGSAKAMASRDFFNPEITSVGTFGSKETKREILDIFARWGISEKEVYEAFNQACYNFLVGEFGDEFNARNQDTLKLSEYHTHVDEEAFHYHAYIVGCGWTKKGKPSKGWNHALREQFEEDYEGMDSESAEANRGRMRKWRSREDREFHSCCIQSFAFLARVNGYTFPSEHFKFVRLNPKDGEKGLDMKTYQRLQDVKSRENEFRQVLNNFGYGFKGDTFKESLDDFDEMVVNTMRAVDEAADECYRLTSKRMNLEDEISELEERKTLEEAKNTNQVEIDAENQRHIQELEKLKKKNKEEEDAERAKVEKEKKDDAVRRQAINELQKDPEFISEARADVGERIYNNLSEERKSAYIKHFMKQDPVNIKGMFNEYTWYLTNSEHEVWDRERARVQQRFNFDLYTQKMNEINAEYEEAKKTNNYKAQKEIKAGRKAVMNKAKKDLDGPDI